jgi:hypothetical protein
MPLSIIALALCILFGSFWIGSSIQKAGTAEPYVSAPIEKALLTQEECAQYLNITEDEMKALIAEQVYQKSQVSSNIPYRYLSFIEINGKKMFSKATVDMWITFSIYGID